MVSRADDWERDRSLCGLRVMVDDTPIHATATATPTLFLHSAYPVPRKAGKFRHFSLFACHSRFINHRQIQAVVPRRMFIDACDNIQFRHSRP